MPPVKFEPAIPTSERPQTHALNRTAIGIGFFPVLLEQTSSSVASAVIHFVIYINVLQINSATYWRNLIKTHKRKVPIIDTLGKAETLVAKLRFLINWLQLNISLFAVFLV